MEFISNSNIEDINNMDNNDSIEKFTERKDDLETHNFNINIYRYKFTQTFMDELYKFSKIHQYDDRKIFKESWTIWIEENETLIQDEIQRLTELRYDGDILDKMFKSARYYFRKKSPQKVEPKDRRQYLSIQKELLDGMDKHITKKLNYNDYKPSEGFTDFCNNNMDLLQEEVTRMVLDYKINDVILIQDKFKKTYKNRYFMLVSKQT